MKCVLTDTLKKPVVNNGYVCLFIRAETEATWLLQTGFHYLTQAGTVRVDPQDTYS
jgi:hypothetical protein